MTSPSHDTFHQGNQAAEKSTRLVMWITLITMVLEIAAGLWFNSMALLADGWHMSSHALAIGLAAFAYTASRRLANDHSFAFGTYKIEVLAAFASAVFLIGVAVLMVVGSVDRLLEPQFISFPEAIAVAVFGLVVNLVCALVLNHKGHDHHAHHGHDHHSHEKHQHHHDLNMKAAYVHVITDALTSVLAIVALLGAWFFGLAWLDPLMGIVGAVLVAVWARGLLAQTSRVLLDREMDEPVVQQLRTVLQERSMGALRIEDLRVWRVGSNKFACAVLLGTENPALTALDCHQWIKEAALPLSWCRIECVVRTQIQSMPD